MRRAYLDNAATTPLTPTVRSAMEPFLGERFGNPSSTHLEGQLARAAIEEAREEVAAALGVGPREVVFTGSGTEADNLAIRGIAWASTGVEPPRVVTSGIEHDAVWRTARWLEARGEIRLTVVPPEADGRVDAGRLLDAVGADTALVSLMWVNNETGVRQPVEEVGEALAGTGTAFHVDGVQALGRVDPVLGNLAADLVTFSAHKVGGPKGCGVLVVRHGVKLQPVLTGGAQEDGLRAGTECVPVVVGGARALADAARGGATRVARLTALTALLEDGLAGLAGARMRGGTAPRAPGITSLGLAGTPASALVQALDVRGFAVSAGSACTSGSTKPSRILAQMGLSDAEAGSTVRVSLGAGTTDEEVRAFLGALPEVLDAVREEVRS